MQKAIRNKSGKPVQVESLDKRDEARNKPSANPVVPIPGTSNAGKDSASVNRLDRDREANRLAQAKTEQAKVSDNPQDRVFAVRSEG